MGLVILGACIFGYGIKKFADYSHSHYNPVPNKLASIACTGVKNLNDLIQRAYDSFRAAGIKNLGFK